MKYILTSCADEEYQPTIFSSSPSLAGLHACILSEGLSILDTEDWARRWCVRITVSELPYPVLGVISYPPLPLSFSHIAVLKDVVYASAENGSIYAFAKAEGTLLWQQGPAFDHAFLTIVNDVLYAGSRTLSALNAQSGELYWSYPTQDVVTSLPIVENGVVYASSYDGYLYALDAQKETLCWAYNTGSRIYQAPAVTHGMVYVATSEGRNNFYAFDAYDGSIRWRTTIQAGHYSPVVVDNVICVGDDASIATFDAQNGTLLWRQNISGTLSADFLHIGGVIYATSSEGIDAIDITTGQRVWHSSLSGNDFTHLSTPMHIHGELYIVAYNRRHRPTLYWLNKATGEAQKIVSFGDHIQLFTVVP